MLFTTILTIAAATLTIYLFKRAASRSHRVLPPGPRGSPLIGNVLDMPHAQEWKTFAQWGKIWGDIMSITLLGQPMVILNSHEHAIELLEKRSVKYSDRPSLLVAGKLVGWDQTVVLSAYGERFRELRSMISRCIGTRTNVERFKDIMEHETSIFLSRVRHDPNSLDDQVRKTAGAIILMIGYGYQVKEGDDELVDVIGNATHDFSELTAPGAFLADLFPILQYVPAWMPGARWKKRVSAAMQEVRKTLDLPYQFVETEMAAGTAIPNFTSMHLTKGVTPERESIIKGAAATLYSGGADTTVSAIRTFFLAMMCYPEAQKKAQKEIDEVIGNDRLPDLSDRMRLPYVNALVLEVLRWNPVAPLGMPHRLVEDDEYAGYYLPKGTSIVVNVWQLLHDPDVYVDPMTFNPDRFFPSNGSIPEPDPHSSVFGFGRRICPGLHLADASVFLSCAMSLAVFNISKPVENGITVEPIVDYTTGTISHPYPFKCAIKPRSATAEALLPSVNVE